MKKHNKVFVYLMIAMLALTAITGGAFAQGGEGNGGGGDGLIKDKVPELTITKFRPKESTEYAWELGATFTEWLEVGEGIFETQLDLMAVREMTLDNFSAYIEAELSTYAQDSLIVDLGYTGPVQEFDENGDPVLNEEGEPVFNDQFISILRFEDVGYTRVDPDGEAIKLTFLWEDIDRSLFDDPDTEEVDGIDTFRLGVAYVKSRGNVGEVFANKKFGLEEHEAYGFAEIQSNLQEVLETARGIETPTVTCTTDKTKWLLDDQVLPLGQGDEFHTQATITTDDPTALEADLVQFQAYPYMENDEVYRVWDGSDPDYPAMLIGMFDLFFPVTEGYIPPSEDNSISTLGLLQPLEGMDPILHPIELIEDQYDYDYELPVGTEGFWAVTASANDPTASIEYVQATYEERTATVTIIAENGDELEYRVHFTFAGNNVATLDDLTLDEVIIDGFDPTQQAYRINTEAETSPESLPVVAGQATDPNAEVSYPENETYNEAGFPLKKFVQVTAEDQTTIMTYSVLFAPEGWTEEDEEEGGGNQGGNGKQGTKTDLQVLAVDNQMVDDFAPDTLSYDVMLPETTRSLPLVTAVAEDAEAVVEHIKPTRLPGQYKIRVKGKKVDPEDPENLLDDEKIYVLNMDVEGLPDGEFIELGAVPVTGITGIWLPPTSDYFVLARTSSQIRFWTSEQLLAPKFKIFVDTPGFNPMAPASEPLATVTTDQLKKSGGGGKHSKSTVDNGDGGYYKYNLKGRNLPNLNVGDHYVLVLFNGDNPVFFGPGDYAMLHFEMGEQVKGSVDHRNRDLNTSGRGSNNGTNQ